MKSLLFVFLIVCIASVVIGNDYTTYQDQEVIKLERRIEKRRAQMGQFFDRPAIRGTVAQGLDTLAYASILSEEVILMKAKKQSITASDDEVVSFMLPLLATQGLIDVTSTQDFRQDKNVQLWLQGQAMTVNELLETGRIMLLWTKIAAADVEVSNEEVKSFIERNPDLRIVPEKIQVTISKYLPPANVASRGITYAELISPMSSPVIRSTVSQDLKIPNEWRDVKLYLELNRIDPNLRETLSGKKGGDKFGPIELRSGAVLSGTVSAFVPEVDYADSKEFWQMASIRARLEKANQEEIFEQLVVQYLDDVSPAVRGFWGSLWGGIKKVGRIAKKVVNIGTSIGGGVLGFIKGGPIGAIFGAQVGYQIGNTITGWFSSPHKVFGQVAPPPLPQIPNFEDYRKQFPSFYFPQAYRYQHPVRPQRIPVMPANYPMIWNDYQMDLPNDPAFRYYRRWSPPIYSGYPIRYIMY